MNFAPRALEDHAQHAWFKAEALKALAVLKVAFMKGVVAA
jgi:hypothetical protein